MVQEPISNKAKYIGLMEQCEDRYEERAQQFLQPGLFSGDVGDLMVKATVNVLKIPLTLLTSTENYPIINITPEGDAEMTVRLLHIVERDLVTTMQSSKVNQEWKKVKKPGDEKGDASLKPHRCTCGINNKELRNVCCNPEASTGRQYASRCPRLKGQQSCGGNCKRNGCNNPYGKKVNANITKIKSSKRKRNKTKWEERGKEGCSL